MVPAISWTTPATATQGTPFGAMQLNAVVSVPGAFAYSPAAGTVLTAGTHTLTATFTPADTTLYTTATAYLSLTVNPATCQLTASRPSGGMVHKASTAEPAQVLRGHHARPDDHRLTGHGGPGLRVPGVDRELLGQQLELRVGA